MLKLNINIYTDGACMGNPGPGGWASLIFVRGNGNNKEIKKNVVIKGGELDTTNNRMEILAVLKSLELLKKRNVDKYVARITIKSDSKYVIDSIKNGYIYKWNFNGWKTTKQTDVKNKDLWIEMLELLKQFTKKDLKVRFVKVKGHDGERYNEYVDKIAVEESRKQNGEKET